MVEEAIQSKKQEVWTRLYSKLELNPGAPAPGGRGRVLMAIRPTISVDDLLEIPSIKNATVELTATAVTFFTVPDDEQWIFYAYDAGLAAGDRDLRAVNLVATAEDGGGAISIDAFAAVAIRQIVLAQPIRMRQGWTIDLVGTGGSTNGNWTCNIYVKVEQLSSQ